MKEEKETSNVLDDIKQVQKVIKAKMLIKAVMDIKKMAKEVLELKEKTNYILEEIGLDEKDIKRVIDFVNNLPEVQLTESQKKSLRESVKQDTTEKKDKLEKEIQDKGFDRLIANNGGIVSNYTDGSISGMGTYTTCNAVNLNSNDGSLEIKI